MRTILRTMCDPNTGWLLMRSPGNAEAQNDGRRRGQARKAGCFSGQLPRFLRSGIWDFCPTIIPIGRSLNVSSKAVLDLQLRGQGRRG